MTVTSFKDTNLFKPLKVGNVTLAHRVAHLPTTRFRAADDHTATDLQLKYYADRAATPGTLLVTEATSTSARTGFYPNIPAIWESKHVESWKKVTDAVHEKGSFISIQLWSLGRVFPHALAKAHGLEVTSASATYPSDEFKKDAEAAGMITRALTEEEIKDIIVTDFTNAAKNALEAGFDFIEVHSANGYLLEQFIQPSSNQRTDKYGGSIENRARFLLELIDHLLTIVPAEKLALRLSPYNTFQGTLGKDEAIHPIVQYGYILDQLQKRADKSGKELAYLSYVDSSITATDFKQDDAEFVRALYKGVLLRGGAYSYYEDAKEAIVKDAQDEKTIIGFGRVFISNPDLPERVKEGHPLTPYDRSTFYTNDNWGYNTYLRYNEETKYDKEVESKVSPMSLVAKV
ncbi:uncharacterized protein KQ657_003254 [Scheffersomyces spartinae]|uniref:Probable NADPH dehydrogenase n=1 Tax=Scheffersomyces spartinae TaxID=45513 RepID=A0A9P7VDU9_9ASCO|nr:uncharacterized protein KQ657_003254 [Scheffersomyces spartinae]KAG7195491.1 hypothetical protein KQ657_003254 [Scheffersomyces spartinae]